MSYLDDVARRMEVENERRADLAALESFASALEAAAGDLETAEPASHLSRSDATRLWAAHDEARAAAAKVRRILDTQPR